MNHPALLALVIGLGAGGAAVAQTAPSPEQFLGRRVGEDRFLAPWPKVAEYFRALDSASERVTVEVAGKSTLGNDLLVAILTSEKNQRDLERYREISRRLANPDDLSAAEAKRLVGEGKTIVLVTCSIHATEVASTQMAMEFAHSIATTTDPATRRWLDDVILLLMPSINPDGQVLVIDWYNRWLGTEYEGGNLPWLYHPYVGHDNNRDFLMLTQKESRIVNDILSHRWYPQVFLDEHQMGSTGPRMFVPPQTDPIAPDVHSLVFREANLIGTAMSLRLEEAGKAGVGHDMIFDSYWPGGTRNTAWWKNIVGLLTEVASARMATPIYVEPGERAGGVKGLPEYARRSNYPSPWPGGWWRLRDIVDYELVATRSLLETCSIHRENLLWTSYRLNREAIDRGAAEPPFAFVVPVDQHDPVAAARMIDLLLQHGVRVHRATGPITVGRESFAAGTHVVLGSQPYRPLVLTLLRPQRYPEALGQVGGSILPPYDIASWSLPLSMGVETIETELRVEGRLERAAAAPWPGGTVAESRGGYLIPHSADSVFVAMNRLLRDGRKVFWLASPPAGAERGDVFVPADAATADAISTLSREARVPIRPLDRAPIGKALRVKAPHVGLYKPWIASMDEGWTRWLLEQYEFPYTNLVNPQIKDGSFAKLADVLVLPDVEKSIIKEGKPPEEERRGFVPLPPEYAGGLDKEGGEQIRKWVVEQGGAIVALDSSCDYVIELLELPVENVFEKLTPGTFNCPGSHLQLRVDTTHPIAYGMRPDEVAFFAGSAAFRTRPPDARFDRRVVASYPDDEKDLLVSGYVKGGEILERRAAVVDVRVGKGRVILIGFRAQYRAQPTRTFKLLFNALYAAGLVEETL